MAPQVSSERQQSQSSSSQTKTTDVDAGPNTPVSATKLLKWEYDATLKDIDKLVKLSTEIKEDMEKAGENVLPLATLKKLDELERLTKKIRGRIKK